MSLLHMTCACVIGFVVGFVTERLALQKAIGGIFGFVCIGIAGAFAGDLMLRVFVNMRWVSPLFYTPPLIAIEQLLGAVFSTYGWLLFQGPMHKTGQQ